MNEEECQGEEAERAELVHEHDVKTTTVIFMIAATLVEVVLSFVFIAVLFVCVGLAARLCGATTLVPLQLSSPVVFIGGLVAGYNVYKRVMRLAIDKLCLKDRLRADVYEQYLTRAERRRQEDTR